MDFDELYKSIILSESTVLELVDEYTLYCFYTNIDPLIPKKAYNAPYYRKDSIPSFSIFPSTSPIFEYMWKDHATGDKGNIFQLIRNIEQLNSKEEVLARINDDFCLGFNSQSPPIKEKIVWFERPPLVDIKITVQSKPFSEKGLAFWNQFKIKEDLLKFYNTTEVDYYWMIKEQKAPTTAHQLTFSYEVGGYYQLYSPYAPRENKFRNDLPENYFFGYLQLPKNSKTLVIDKSMKDVIFCRQLNYWAVAPKSESTHLPEAKMYELKDRFEEVFLCLDNDSAGRKQVEKYMSTYPWLKPRYLPQWKDKSDNCLQQGFEETERVVREMLQ